MKKFLITAVVASALLLTGCPASPEEQAAAQQLAKSKNESSFSNPEVVGRLADGRFVKRVVVAVPRQWDQYVYFVDNATVSTNYNEPHGKTTTLQTRVSLSAVPTADEIIAAADDLKKQQLAADQAELARLQKKLGNQ